MTRLSQSDMEGLLAFLRACDAHPTMTELRSHLVPALRDLIPSDHGAYLLTDRHTGELAWYTDVEEVTPEQQALFRRWEHQHPTVAWYRANPGGPALQVSDFISSREWRALDLYADVMGPLGIDYQMSVTLVVTRRASVGLPLNRTDRAFSERDRLVLNLLRPHLLQLHRRVYARERARDAITALEREAERSGRAVVLLRPGDRQQLTSEQAWTWLRDYFPDPAAAPGRLPSALADWLRGARRRLDRTGELPEPDRVLNAVGTHGRLSVRYLPPTPVGDPETLLLEERRDALTAREADVLGCATRGLTHAQIAAELRISPRTVETHLGRVYKKLGVRGRGQLPAAA